MSTRYNQLGRTGLSVSAIGCGSNALRFHSQEEADRALNYALDLGVNLVETGRPYGETEAMIQRAVGHRRAEYVLLSKTVLLEGAAVRQEVETSLQTLKTDRLDGYQLAYVNTEDKLAKALAPGGGLDALREARRAGQIGFIGIGGHRPDLLARAVRAGGIDYVLYIFNMAISYARLELLPLCKSLGVGTLVMRPMDHGALAPASLSLRYALSFGHDCVLCGMYSPAHVDEDLQVAEHDFSDSEVADLRARGDELPATGCRLCNLCLPCPHQIGIPTLMTWLHYRQRYSLMPTAEVEWQTQATRARDCDDCGLCEPRCPYGLAIIPRIHEAAATA